MVPLNSTVLSLYKISIHLSQLKYVKFFDMWSLSFR